MDAGQQRGQQDAERRVEEELGRQDFGRRGRAQGLGQQQAPLPLLARQRRHQVDAGEAEREHARGPSRWPPAGRAPRRPRPARASPGPGTASRPADPFASGRVPVEQARGTPAAGPTGRRPVPAAAAGPPPTRPWPVSSAAARGVEEPVRLLPEPVLVHGHPGPVALRVADVDPVLRHPVTRRHGPQLDPTGPGVVPPVLVEPEPPVQRTGSGCSLSAPAGNARSRCRTQSSGSSYQMRQWWMPPTRVAGLSCSAAGFRAAKSSEAVTSNPARARPPRLVACRSASLWRSVSGCANASLISSSGEPEAAR